MPEIQQFMKELKICFRNKKNLNFSKQGGGSRIYELWKNRLLASGSSLQERRRRLSQVPKPVDHFVINEKKIVTNKKEIVTMKKKVDHLPQVKIELLRAWRLPVPLQ